MATINNRSVERFLRNLLDPEMFGHAVTAEVRDEARKLLGMQPVETVKRGVPSDDDWNISAGDSNWNFNEGV